MDLSYLWSTGDTSATTTIYSPGWAWVTVSNGPCQFTDSVYFENGNLYGPPFRDTAYCDSIIVDFTDTAVLSTMNWTSLGLNSTVVTFSETGYYPFIATDVNGCQMTDSIYYRTIGDPYIDEGFGCPNYTLTATDAQLYPCHWVLRRILTRRHTVPFAGSHELTLVIDSCEI